MIWPLSLVGSARVMQAFSIHMARSCATSLVARVNSVTTSARKSPKWSSFVCARIAHQRLRQPCQSPGRRISRHEEHRRPRLKKYSLSDFWMSTEVGQMFCSNCHVELTMALVVTKSEDSFPPSNKASLNHLFF